MAVFYERVENSEEIRITFNRWIFFIVAGLLLGFFISFAFGYPDSFILGAAFVLFFTLVLIDTWKPNKEIKKAQSSQGVQIKGSYFSLSNPIVIIIIK